MFQQIGGKIGRDLFKVKVIKVTGMLGLTNDISWLLDCSESQINNTNLIEDYKSRIMAQIRTAVSEKTADGRKYQVQICKVGTVEKSMERGVPSSFYRVWANVFLLDPEEAIMDELVVINWLAKDESPFFTQTGKIFQYLYTAKGDRIWKRIA